MSTAVRKSSLHPECKVLFFSFLHDRVPLRNTVENLKAAVAGTIKCCSSRVYTIQMTTLTPLTTDTTKKLAKTHKCQWLDMYAST